MGTWGSGIFDDDLALDIKGHFDDAVAGGTSPAEAAKALMQSELAQEIIEEFSEDERDEMFWEESGGLFFAVATLQLEHGVLQPDVREQTLRAIDHWLALAEGDVERTAMLEALESRLKA
jgi:hypothetical protein